MPSWKRKRLERSKVRDPNVAPMRFRKSGLMEHRNKQRGGAKNLAKEAINSDEKTVKDIDTSKPFYEADESDEKDFHEYEDSKYWDDYDDYE